MIDKNSDLFFKTFSFSVLFISFGFVITMFTYWPKEFRGGVLSSLDRIAVIQQENKDKVDKLEDRVLLLEGNFILND